MKIIVLSSNTCWSVFNFRLELIRSLANNFQLEIIAPEDEYSNKLRAMGFIVHDIPMASSSIAPLRDLRTFLAYSRLLKKIKPDYYLGFTAKPNIYGGFVAGFFGGMVVNNIAGLGRTFSNPGLLQRSMQLLYWVGLKKSKHVFFQNKDDLALFESNGLINQSKCSVLPGSGVNINRFSFKATAQSASVIQGVLPRFTFLFSARLLIEKGIREYIAAATKLKAIYPHCVFQVLGKHAGSSAELSKIELDAACARGVVEYLGTTDDVVSVLHRTNCFVLPSFYREGVPRSLLEAGSCGLPLITTDSVGCRETVLDGINGFLVEPRSIDSLIQAMIKMITMPLEERIAMGVASRVYMEKSFDEAVVIRRYLEVIR